MWSIDQTFAQNYECNFEVEAGGSSGSSDYYFPPRAEGGGRDGVMFRVEPLTANKWRGTFAFGTIQRKGLSGVFTTPDPNRILVVSRGEGYLVNSEDPTEWERVATIPTLAVRSVKQRRIIVLSSFTKFAAYSEFGLLWVSHDVTGDDLSIISVDNEFVTGEYWDFPSESLRRVRLSLMTGKLSDLN